MNFNSVSVGLTVQVNEVYIGNVINKLKNKSSCGYDNISNKHIKYARSVKPLTLLEYISLSARILHRAPPPPAPSGPKFSNSENCCGSENAMPPKIFWDMECHRGNFR